MILKNYLNNMTQLQIKLEWKKVLEETHKIYNLDLYKNKLKRYQQIVILRELLLFCQVVLEKIKTGKNNAFNETIYKKNINFYCTQIKRYG